MNCLLVSTMVVLVSTSAGAMAECSPSAPQVQGASSLREKLQGNTVCANRGADRWQEFHRSDGALIDYKKGSTDPIDPTKQVGTWSVTGNGPGTKVNYVYGPNERYSYTFHSNGSGGYSLCDGSTAISVTLLLNSAGPCP